MNGELAEWLLHPPKADVRKDFEVLSKGLHVWNGIEQSFQNERCTRN
jgi:hypothetical protein